LNILVESGFLKYEEIIISLRCVTEVNDARWLPDDGGRIKKTNVRKKYVFRLCQMFHRSEPAMTDPMPIAPSTGFREIKTYTGIRETQPWHVRGMRTEDQWTAL